MKLKPEMKSVRLGCTSNDRPGRGHRAKVWPPSIPRHSTQFKIDGPGLAAFSDWTRCQNWEMEGKAVLWRWGSTRTSFSARIAPIEAPLSDSSNVVPGQGLPLDIIHPDFQKNDEVSKCQISFGFRDFWKYIQLFNLPS